MRFSPGWLSRAVAVAAGTAMVVAASPVMTAMAAESAAVAFAGYTDKTALKTEGRTIVKNDALPVTDGSAPQGTGTTYYVDSNGGNDANDGKSEATAWKSLEKVNAVDLEPGDRVLLKAGSVWNAEGDTVAKEVYDYAQSGVEYDTDETPTSMLYFDAADSGTAEAPIILSSYGTGDAPELNGRGVVNDVIQLSNAQHWSISNVELSNITDGFDASKFKPKSDNGQKPGTENAGQGDLRAIHVMGENAGYLDGFEIFNTYIHDVSGVVWSVGKAGNDRSKRTGGILFEGLKGDKETVSRIRGVNVHDNYIANTSFGNIVFKQYTGNGTDRNTKKMPGWGDRLKGRVSSDGTVKEDPYFSPHQNITIKDNYLTNGESKYAWDSLYLTSVQNVTVEGNAVDSSGVSGIEMYFADNVLVQDNELYDMQKRTGAADSNGIDPDSSTTNILIQYNYIHESNEGILLCGFQQGSSAVVRYNILANIGRNYVNPHGTYGVNVVYNNLMYNNRAPASENKGVVRFFASSGSTGSIFKDNNKHYVFNNAFVNAYDSSKLKGDAVFQSGTGVTIDNNAYYGGKVTVPSVDKNAVTGDPKLKGDSSKDFTQAAVSSMSSALIGSGRDVDLTAVAPGWSNTGNTSVDQSVIANDIYGNKLSNDIGPSGYVLDASKALVSGVVRDADGDPVTNAKVYFSNKAGTKVEVDENGRYSWELSPGEGKTASYSYYAESPDYENSTAKSIKVTGGQTYTVDITLGKVTATTGSISGRVMALGVPVAGATVTAAPAAQTFAADGETGSYTATTDANGEYTITGVPAGVSYTVTATKEGYASLGEPETVTVKAAKSVAADATVKQTAVEAAKTIIDDNFTYAEKKSGWTGQGDWKTVLPSSTSVGDVAMVKLDNGKTRYVKITKDGESKGVVGFYNATPLNLTGKVTIEVKLQRTADGTRSANQGSMYWYDESTFNTSLSGMSDPTATILVANGAISTHKGLGDKSAQKLADFSYNEWHDVKQVYDVDANTYEVWIDGELKFEGTGRTKVENLDHVGFYIDGTNTGDLLVDDLKITQGIDAEGDVTLNELSVQYDGADVDYTRNGDTFSAALTDPFAETVTVKAGSVVDGAKVTINDVDVKNGAEIALDKATGEDTNIVTELPIVVTSADGKTSKTYTLQVSRPNPAQATYLKSLAVKDHAFTTAFEYDNPNLGTAENPYVVDGELPADTDSVTVEFVRGHDEQTVKVNGTEVAADANSADVALQDGENTIEVNSNSFTGEDLTYTIKVTRASNGTVDPDPEPEPETATTVYYVDAGVRGTDTSDTFEGKTDLINEKADQSYSAKDGWGSLAGVKLYAGDKTNTSDPDADGLVSTGKTMRYRLKLDAGTYKLTAGAARFGTDRTMKLSVSGADATATIAVDEAAPTATGEVEFTLTGTKTITVTLTRVSGANPSLAWLQVDRITK